MAAVLDNLMVEGMKMEPKKAKAIKPPPAIPVEVDLWDFNCIGAYLKRSAEVVRERYSCLPDFPKPVRLPSAGGGKGHALYKAREIIAWAEKYAS